MQSYPSELLSHALPLLHLAPNPALLPSPPAAATAPAPSTSEYQDLVHHLVTHLVTQEPKFPFWHDPNEAPSARWHAVVVDQNQRLPPLKSRPPPTLPASTPTHSPISPLSPSSPLYPDGILAPIWIRKHRELVPAVLVLVEKLYEPPPVAEGMEQEDDEALQAKQEAADQGIINLVLSRRKATADRPGLKLVLILLCSRALLSSPTLDGRLSAIRRASTLDSRASLFVLSPVTKEEVKRFTIELKAEVYPSAIDYAREHGRRTRRKRARLAGAPAAAFGAAAAGVGAAGTPGSQPQVLQRAQTPLPEKGWQVRWEYKLGYWAEVRREWDVALKHYSDAYATLLLLFSPTGSVPSVLQPRTKRWAESKVLSDCLVVKLLKLDLYVDLALVPPPPQGQEGRGRMNVKRRIMAHLDAFEALSEGWGTGNGTFEFWSWKAKQYRIYAELLTIFLRSSGLPLPLAFPTPLPSSLPQHGPSTPLGPSGNGINPRLDVLQHPGFWYAFAAQAMGCRWDRFKDVLRAHKEKEGPGGAAAAPDAVSAPLPPSIQHEMKINHAELIIELLTKAYEHFKAFKSSRQTYSLASRIARTYWDAGDHAMAFKFHERVVKSYRREGWKAIEGEIMRLAVDSALGQQQPAEVQQQPNGVAAPEPVATAAAGEESKTAAPPPTKEEHGGDIVAAVRLLFGLLSPESNATPDEREEYEKTLFEVLHNRPRFTAPASDGQSETIVLDSKTAAPLFECRSVFWHSQAHFGEPVPFQLSLATSAASRSSGIAFKSLLVEFSDPESPILLPLEGAPATGSAIQVINLGVIEPGAQPIASAPSSWANGGTVILSGALTRSAETDLAILSVTLEIAVGEWSIKLVMDPLPGKKWGSAIQGTEAQLFSAPVTSAATCRIRPRPTRLAVTVNHATTSYLDEEFAISVEVKNDEQYPVDCVLDILLQPGEDDCPNRFDVDGQASSSFMKAIPIGILEPSSTLSKTFRLISVGLPGARVLDLTIRCSPTTETPPEIVALVAPVTEVWRTVTIPASHPLFCSFEMMPRRQKKKGAEGTPTARNVTLDATMGALGPFPLEILAVSLNLEAMAEKVVQGRSSLDGDLDAFPATWESADTFGLAVDLTVTALDAPPQGRPGPGFLEVSWRRAEAKAQAPCITRIALPKLVAPTLEPIISARTPRQVHLDEPSRFQYKLSNPTGRALKIRSQIDQGDSFVINGVRRHEATIPPAGERILEVLAIPIAVGHVPIPRLRIFEFEDSPTANGGLSDDVAGEPASQEMRCVEEHYLADPPPPGGTAKDARVVRNDQPPPYRVLVLARPPEQ